MEGVIENGAIYETPEIRTKGLEDLRALMKEKLHNEPTFQYPRTDDQFLLYCGNY